MTWTIEHKIQIIRGFSPIEKPSFKNEDTIGYILWNLYSRVCDAMKSFSVLLDNKRYYDSFVIAGHALETSSILSYVKDNNTEEKRKEHFEQYLASSAVSRLRTILDMSQNLEKEVAWNSYLVMLKMLLSAGASIIKSNKDHKEVIEKLSIRNSTNAEKINLLKCYTPISIAKYISSFVENMGNIDDGQFDMYYTKYCNYKHSNMLAPGALAGDIDSGEIDWFLHLMLGIIMYLDKSKLTPCMSN